MEELLESIRQTHTNEQAKQARRVRVGQLRELARRNASFAMEWLRKKG